MNINDLNNELQQKSIISESEILFEYSRFHIVIEVSYKVGFVVESDDFFKSLLHFKKLDETIIKNIVNIDSFYISDYEYLGHREDIGSYSVPVSISSKMYLFLRTLHLISSDIVLNYHLGSEYGNDIMCTKEPNYLFKIYININGSYNIKEILNKLSNYETEATPCSFYWIFYKKNKSLGDNNTTKLLTTNTKTRRLGYLKLLSSFIFSKKKISISKINKQFEKYVSNVELDFQLQSYKNNKGIVNITKTGASGKPYIELSENLGLLSKINNIYTSSKNLKVYNAIVTSDNNVFKLSLFDKIFFTERVLNEDFLYISVLLELVFIHKTTTYTNLKKVFRNTVINRIDSYLSDKLLSDSSQRKIFALKNRILNWKKPDVYLEHVLMPRINWLFDLDYLSIDSNNTIEISLKGELFFSHICFWYDIERGFVINPLAYTQRFIQHTFTSENTKTEIEDYLRQRINKYIDESFEIFKTLAPNRTTSSQAINYTKYKIFLEDKIPVEYKFIENHIITNAKERYIYKFQHQYNDGYIQKK